MAKAVSAGPRPLGSHGGVTKALEAWPRPWGRGQGLGIVA